MLPRPVLLLLACTACAHRVTAPPLPPVVAASIHDVPTTAASAPALGPSDRELPAPANAAAPFEFVATGPARPLGAAPVRRARPDAPGRRGTLLLAIDTPYQLYGRASSYVHVAAWYPDGRPAAGADVFVDRRGVGRTDRHGTLVFRRGGGPAADGPGADAHGLDDGATLFVVAPGDRCGAVGFTPYTRTPAFASDQLYVYTDRGVFRPGETIHVRAIGWRLQADHAPLEAANVELRLRDAEGRTLVAGQARTDTFGTAALDLVVPRDADAGDYELEVVHGGTTESASLQIRRFETPALRIAHDLPRWLARDTDALAFTVTAHSANGGALDAATIVARVIAPDGRRVTRRRAVRGAGPHSFAVDAKAFASLRADLAEGASMRVEIEVTDGRGRSDTVQRAITFVDQPWIGVLEPDRDAYAPGDRVHVVARVSDRDDVAMRAGDLTLVLSPSGQRHTARTDAAGMASFAFDMPAEHQHASLYADGQTRVMAEAELPAVAPVPMRAELAAPIVRERSSTAVVVRFPLGHVPIDRRVHLDLTDTSGAIVGAAVLRAEREDRGWVARGHFTAPTWGSALVTFFALGRAPGGGAPGLLVGGHQLAVQPDRELEITLEGVPERAAPGAELDVRATVRSADGEVRPFAASAALVDRAVLAMHDPLEVTPMDRFYDPDLRTLATTGAQMLTWPVVSRNWGTAAWDIALPPFAFAEAGERGSCTEHYDDRDFAALTVKEVTVAGAGAGATGSGFGAAGLGVGGMAVGVAAGPTDIVVRTRFADTSLWLPQLRGTGETRFEARLPEGTGEQELVVVASDREGGVGIARRTIAVTQPLFVRPDLPDTMIEGERVEVPVVVHNRTARSEDVAVALSAGDEVARAQLVVGSMDEGRVVVPLTAPGAGSSRVRVEARGKHEQDAAVHTMRVQPRGVAIVRREAAGFDRDGRARFTAVRRADAPEQAHLAIVFPTRVAAGLGAESLLRDIVDDPHAIVSDLAAAAAIVRWAGGRGGPELERLRSGIGAAIGMLARVQDPSGRWSYWRHGKPSAYVTALALDGLLEARAAGFDVPATTLATAAASLAEALDGGALLPASELGWWEGDETRVREGLTAEVFAILARIPEAERSPRLRRVLEALSDRHRDGLRAHTLDVRASAHAVLAMQTLGTLDGPDAEQALAHLLDARDHGHWEPTWFSAYGGTIEATAAAVEALASVGGTDHALALRDAVRWLAGTAPSWGQWHNERGTTAAVRALARLGAPTLGAASVVTVRVDGTVVATARVDPDDPVGSTLSLAHVELPALAVGSHVVEVEHDGAVHPTVALVGKRWHRGAAGRVAALGHELAASAPAALDVGDDATLRVELAGPRLGGATLRIAKGGLVELDLDRIGPEIGRGRTIARIRDDGDAIELALGPDAVATTLALPIRVVRRGEGSWPTLALQLAGRRGRGVDDDARRALVVDPGPLRVQRRRDGLPAKPRQRD